MRDAKGRRYPPVHETERLTPVFCAVATRTPVNNLTMPDLIHGAASGLVDPPVVMAPHPAPAPDPAPVQKSTRNGHRGPAAERWSLNDRLSELGYPEDLSRITRIKLWLFPHRCKGSTGRVCSEGPSRKGGCAPGDWASPYDHRFPVIGSESSTSNPTNRALSFATSSSVTGVLDRSKNHRLVSPASGDKSVTGV